MGLENEYELLEILDFLFKLDIRLHVRSNLLNTSKSGLSHEFWNAFYPYLLSIRALGL